MIKTYRFEADLTLQEVLVFKFIANFSPVDFCTFAKLRDMLEESGLDEIRLSKEAEKFGIEISGEKFSSFINSIIEKNTTRKTVTIGDKTYYEDELAEALSNIKEVK